MSWSYDPLLPSAMDRIRLAVGDADAMNQLRADETINALMTAHGEAEATARLAEGLATQYAQQPDSIGDDGSTISWRDRVKTWLELAKRMRAEAVAITAGIGSVAYSIGTTRGEVVEAEYRRPDWW